MNNGVFLELTNNQMLSSILRAAEANKLQVESVEFVHGLDEHILCQFTDEDGRSCGFKMSLYETTADKFSADVHHRMRIILGFPFKPTLNWRRYVAWVTESHGSHDLNPRDEIVVTSKTINGFDGTEFVVVEQNDKGIPVPKHVIDYERPKPKKI